MEWNARVPPVPKFAAKSELARYIDPDLCPRGRISSAAYLKKVGEPYLSTNSLEINSPQELAPYYCELFQAGNGPVAIHCRKILDYNRAAKAAEVIITYDKTNKLWQFPKNGQPEPAYKHRPTKNSSPHYSHCGVEFVDSPEYVEKKFARRITRGSPHVFP